MSRTIHFVATAADAAPPVSGVEQIVIDTAWTPDPKSRHDLRPLRPMIRDALIAGQPAEEAMHLIDAWAAGSGLVEKMALGGLSHWYRRRVVYWRWLHDRIVWQRVLDGLAAEGEIGRVRVPANEPELLDMARLAGVQLDWQLDVAEHAGADPARDRAPRTASSLIRGVARRLPLGRTGPTAAEARRAALADRKATLLDRVRAIAQGQGSLLALSDPAVRQSIAVDGRTEVRDVFLDPVLSRLAGTRLDPVKFEVGTGYSDDAAWSRLSGPGQERTLPGAILGAGYADPSDDDDHAVDVATVLGRLEAPLGPLLLGDLDVGPILAADLRSFAANDLASALRATARISRFLEDLRPSAILLINEYSRTEWIAAARRTQVPIAAVQHGIIHRWHPGYVFSGDVSSAPLVDRMYVFGSWEARLLVDGGVHPPAAVLVSGAPRLDWIEDRGGTAADRLRTRAELGVTPDERAVVVSSTSSVAARRFPLAAALDGILDRPLRGVRLVIKLHPGEDDGEFYQGFVAGIARARGFEAPPLTIVRAIDLYRLLAAADAHLGLYSTVLTDAVVSGTSNLVITSLAGSDILGYVAAGVARPVQDGGDLLDALDRPAGGPDAEQARAVFLADHFAPGDASGRIAADLLERFGAPPLGSDH